MSAASNDEQQSDDYSVDSRNVVLPASRNVLSAAPNDEQQIETESEKKKDIDIHTFRDREKEHEKEKEKEKETANTFRVSLARNQLESNDHHSRLDFALPFQKGWSATQH